VLKFQDLYKSYATDIYRLAYWLSGDRLEAEDITSDTFVRVWTHRDDIRAETLKAYLLMIARNVYLERQRKRKQEVRLEDVRIDPSPEPDRFIESKLTPQKVENVLETLPEIDHAALVLRAQQGLPYDEIARVLGLSFASAKVKVHRVRKKLITAQIDEEVN
jgi:RNA polymerase sigma-70 factor (ECF subfamily)